METQTLTYKFRLNPRREQHRALETILEQQRQLTNAAIAEREDFYRKNREAFLNLRTFRQQLALYRKRIKAWINSAKRAREREAHNAEIQAAAAVRLFHEYRLFRRHRPPVPKQITGVDQSRSLTQIRADDPAWALVQRRIQRETLRRVDRAYAAFFRRAAVGGAPGYPKYKGREYFDGFGFDSFHQITLAPQTNRQPIPEGSEQKRRRGRYDRLRFAGMRGGLRVFVDREMPSAPKSVWFKREANGVWYTGFPVERECAPERTTGKDIGVDWGTSALAVLSTGEIIENPRHAYRLENKLGRAQRKVARAKKGSKQRRIKRAHKRTIDAKIRNRRKDALNKISKRLALQYRTVATEEFSVRAMMASDKTVPKPLQKARNRAALDAAPYAFREMIAYKSRLYGARHGLGGAPEKDRRSSTEVCSGELTNVKNGEWPYCWATVSKELSEVWHHCPHCGYVAKRKHNAARVILIRALHRGGPVPGDAKPSKGSVCPGNTGDDREISAGRRPKGLHRSRTEEVADPG